MVLCDAQDLVQKCQGCQWMGRNTKAPPTPLQSLPSVWLNIIRPFLPAKSNLRFAFIAIKYFSRWVEAEHVVKITAVTA